MNDQHFVLGFEIGDFDIYQVSQSESGRLKIVQFEHDRSKDHYEKLSAIDYHPGLNLLLSTCLDGLVKVWLMPHKKLLREIRFPH